MTADVQLSVQPDVQAGRRAGVLADAGPTPTDGLRIDPARRAWVEQLMGMPVSIHVRGPRAHDADVARTVEAAFASLHAVDAMFSTYRNDSEISRLQRHELTLAECSAEIRDVHTLCRTALERTAGYFDAWGWRGAGVFDPTGLVKGWAIGRAGLVLAALDDCDVAIDAGGDVLVRCADPDGLPWRIGIEDPRDRTQVLATVELHDGAVATSGTAARGTHIVDPFTKEPVESILSATVIGPSIVWADVWATTAVARGAGAVEWTESLHGTSGMVVLANGTVHRWSLPD
ncbi:MAG TPA: FAD:protein FMN transferase [Cellulomonas sp.]|uniref:FAD:protein FMN transferase n=1 Tax=Cellulomonas sp. TaxID=40001 RepID=UPI002E3272B1|nr:FAD:protein FMN transferase [Cellulomonas sp.]HEX5332885.1 FAD:protein FMN transferase [Cellulomonas sp.]